MFRYLMDRKVCKAVARGGAAFCSHCGYKIRLSDDGKIENPK